MGDSHGDDPMKILKLNLDQFHDTGFHLDVDTTLPPLVPWLPAYMTLVNPSFFIGSGQINKMVEVKTPTLVFKLNSPYHLDAGIGVGFVDTSNLNAYLHTLMAANSAPSDLIISADLDVEILGTICMFLSVFHELGYRGLHVEKIVKMTKDPNAPPAPVKNSTMAVPPELAIDHPSMSFIRKFIQFLDELMRQAYPNEKDRIVMGGNLPDIAWKQFSLDMSDTGISLRAGLDFENPVRTCVYPLNLLDNGDFGYSRDFIWSWCC